MNKNNFTLAFHSDNPVSLSRERPFSGAVVQAALRFIAAGIAAMLPLIAQTTLAGSATWKSNPGSGNWNTAGNWSPMTVPNGPADTATFATSSQTAVSLSANTEVDGIIFNPGASAFTITPSPTFALTLSGAGITNDSGVAQNFVADGADVVEVSPSMLIIFTTTATAGSSTAFTTNGSLVSGGYGGATLFYDTSSAANGTFYNNPGTVDGASGGYTYFLGSSTAVNGTFINNGGTVSGSSGGSTFFGDTSTAGNGIFTNNGGTVSGASGGFLLFTGFSSAGNGTLIANGGLGGSGAIYFYADSIGGTSRVKVFGNGSLDISAHDAPGVTIGSLEGDGDVLLGTNKLTVGSNNLSTTFPGLIEDGSPPAGKSARSQNTISGGATGGSLAKIGTGTLRLSGANTYTGGTSVTVGRLMANNSSGSGTGSGKVVVGPIGVLGGTGAISGPVDIIFAGPLPAGTLLGGNATIASGALSIANDVTFYSGATIQLVLGASGAHSTLTRTGGTWSFDANQRFNFLDLGAQPGVYDNIITGLAGDPGGTASWTINNAGFTGTFTYDGAGNIDLNLTATAGPVLQLTAAVSRKTHGGAGTFNINLPLTGAPGVECRSSGGNHTLRFTFTNNVISGNASVTSGTGVAGTPTFAGNAMTVNLTGVADVQKITVTLSNVTDSLNQVLPDKAVSVNMLRGDTTGNKVVNASDIGQTKSRSGQVVSASNFRSDVTVSGSINASDIGLVKSRSGAGLP